MARSGSLSTLRNRKSLDESLRDNRCVFYARASTEEQTNSIDGQLHAAREYAQSRGLEICREFPDLGTSAVAECFADRKAIKELLAYCTKCNINTILIHRVDRAFRSTLDLANTTVDLEKRGIYLRFITPDVDLSTPIGKMFTQLLVMVAELEINTKRERVDYAMESMRRNRVSRNGAETAGNPNANAPYGWKNASESNGVNAKGKPIYRQLPDPEEQAILRYIIEEYQSSNGSHGILTTISRRLNQELNVPAPSAGKTMIKKGGIPYTPSPEWTPAKVTSVIEHRVLAEEAELPAPLPDIITAAATIRARLAAATSDQ